LNVLVAFINMSSNSNADVSQSCDVLHSAISCTAFVLIMPS